MKLNHEFALPVEPAAALVSLTNLDLVASCLPGAVVVTRDDSSSRVEMETEISLTGRPARFGGMVLRDVNHAMVRPSTQHLTSAMAPPGSSESSAGPAGSTSPSAGRDATGEAAGLLDVLPVDKKMFVGAGVGPLSLAVVALLRHGKSSGAPCVPPVVVVRVP